MALRLGDTAPDFTQDSSEGELSFYDWAGDGWVVFFSHPADYTPVCTTELGAASRRKPEFDERNAKLLGLSVDPASSHEGWIRDIEDTQDTKMSFPIIADADRKVSNLYGMIHPNASDTLTVRSVFFIDPDRKVRATLTYPASTGRNFDELVRVLDSLQLTDRFEVATPADWAAGDDVVIAPSITDEAELARKFPKGYEEVRPYLRITPQPGD
ncbi:MAG: peroxiredoxin [Myxococcota bacterium]